MTGEDNPLNYLLFFDHHAWCYSMVCKTIMGIL